MDEEESKMNSKSFKKRKSDSISNTEGKELETKEDFKSKNKKEKTLVETNEKDDIQVIVYTRKTGA